METSDLINHIKRITAIADTGLLYATTPYDLERYTELKMISLEMLAGIVDQPVSILQGYYLPAKDYPTAKVDVRGLVLNAENKILLVQEQSDACWSLPGGWADIGFSPSEIVKKEIWEETGLQVIPKQLLAVFDKKYHAHPPQPHYFYKIIIQCGLKEGTLRKGFDILDTGFFSIDNLPPLSKNRILKSQIELLFKRFLSGEQTALFD
jgi:ADP-ribose pyrophosphatase YjhB (NUDIX family)